jgi:hypothetical protein
MTFKLSDVEELLASNPPEYFYVDGYMVITSHLREGMNKETIPSICPLQTSGNHSHE